MSELNYFVIQNVCGELTNKELIELQIEECRENIDESKLIIRNNKRKMRRLLKEQNETNT